MPRVRNRTGIKVPIAGLSFWSHPTYLEYHAILNTQLQTSILKLRTEFSSSMGETTPIQLKRLFLLMFYHMLRYKALLGLVGKYSIYTLLSKWNNFIFFLNLCCWALIKSNWYCCKIMHWWLGQQDFPSRMCIICILCMFFRTGGSAKPCKTNQCTTKYMRVESDLSISG